MLKTVQNFYRKTEQVPQLLLRALRLFQRPHLQRPHQAHPDSASIPQAQAQHNLRSQEQESPCIFNIFMDFVLRVALHEIDQLDTDCGIEIEYCINMRSTDRAQRAIDTPSGNRKIKIILYADDIVLFCRSASSL